MLAKKISISLSNEMSEFIEMYQRDMNCKSRSEVFMQALELLRQKHLEEQYRLANDEIDPAWDAVCGDGIDLDKPW